MRGRLRLSKNFVFPTIYVWTSPNMNEQKVPMQKLFLSQSIKSQAHVLTFYAFALQMLFYARCRAYYGHPY